MMINNQSTKPNPVKQFVIAYAKGDAHAFPVSDEHKRKHYDTE